MGDEGDGLGPDPSIESSKKKTKKSWWTVNFSDTPVGRHYYARCCGDHLLRQISGLNPHIRCGLINVNPDLYSLSTPPPSPQDPARPLPPPVATDFSPEEHFILDSKPVRHTLTCHPDLKFRCANCKGVFPTVRSIHTWRPPNWPGVGYRMCEECFKSFSFLSA